MAFYAVYGDGPGVGFSEKPWFPGGDAGVGTGEGLDPGTPFVFAETMSRRKIYQTFKLIGPTFHSHALPGILHEDGQLYLVTGYKVDERGWVHDFNDEEPLQPTITVLVATKPCRL